MRERLLAIGYDFYNKHLLQGQNLDIQYYSNQIILNNSKKVLVIGAGTGRVAIPLHNITNVEALDIDKARLEILKEKEPKMKCYCMNICNDIPEEKYDMIIIPYSTIQLLGNQNNILQALKNCNNLLSDEGLLIFDVSENFNKKTNTERKFLFKDYCSELETNIHVYYESKRYLEYIQFITEFYFEDKKIMIPEIEKYMYYNKLELIEMVNKYMKLEFINDGYQDNFFTHKHLYHCRKRQYYE